MAPLKHWRDDDLPPEVGRLLRAARNDSPRRSVIDRAALMIGSAATVGTATTGVLGAVTKVSAAGLGWTSKWGAAALLGIGLGTGAAVTARHYTEAAEQAASAPSSNVKPAWRASPKVTDAQPQTASASPLLASTPVVPSGAAQNPDPSPVGSLELQRPLMTKAPAEPSTHGQAQTPEISEARPPVPSDPSIIAQKALEDPQLAEEMSYLDRARGALRESRARDALRWLDGYQRNCPAQRLLPEALLLRLRAEMRAGNRAGAITTARDISLRFPESPHAARAREIIASGHFE